MDGKRRGASYQFIYRRFGRAFAAYHSTPSGRLVEFTLCTASPTLTSILASDVVVPVPKTSLTFAKVDYAGGARTCSIHFATRF